MTAYLQKGSMWIFYRHYQVREVLIAFETDYQVLPGTVFVRRLYSHGREQANRTVRTTKLKTPIIKENTVHLHKDM